MSNLKSHIFSWVWISHVTKPNSWVFQEFFSKVQVIHHLNLNKEGILILLSTNISTHILSSEQSNLWRLSRPAVSIKCLSVVSGLDLWFSACKVKVSWRWCEQQMRHRTTFSSRDPSQGDASTDYWGIKASHWLGSEEKKPQPVDLNQVTAFLWIWWRTAGETSTRIR